ncbi:MAG: DUF1552 domain-containing protein [Deltaproteobacteria bacterium]|nr:DUF1552 domain-containing protein [Deltaproteobacteria bacterium]
MKALARRTLLRGAGKVAVALPFLEAMRPARAASVVPKRFVFMFSPCGSIAKSWTPTGGETDFQLSRILKPLEPLKSDVVILNGVDNIASMNGPGGAHQVGIGALLTGRELGPGNDDSGNPGRPAGLASGISVDQVIAKQLGTETKFRSVEFGVQCSKGSAYSYVNYLDFQKPLPADNDPNSIFRRLFSEAGGDDAAITKLRQQRKTILDAVLENAKGLNTNLGHADKQRLEEHLTSIRDLETRLAAVAGGTECKKPTLPSVGSGNDAFPAIGQIQMDLLVMALKCDLTRVATLQWSNAASTTRFTWVGVNKEHHEMSHYPDGDAATQESLIKVNTWYCQQFATVAAALKQASDGASGSLLDNTVMLWGNELAYGNRHSHDDMPFVMAGGSKLGIKTGRNLKFNGNVPHNNLLVSIMNALDVPAQTFGDPKYCTGPLKGLLA